MSPIPVCVMAGVASAQPSRVNTFAAESLDTIEVETPFQFINAEPQFQLSNKNDCSNFASSEKMPAYLYFEGERYQFPKGAYCGIDYEDYIQVPANAPALCQNYGLVCYDSKGERMDIKVNCWSECGPINEVG